jgi:hypothetical protein
MGADAGADQGDGAFRGINQLPVANLFCATRGKEKKMARPIHPRTEAEKDQRASEHLRELVQTYGDGESDSITLEEARARTAVLISEANSIQ